MIEGIPRISVLIICYKQEELIKRAINSLLSQKDYIYEICVSDDCSPDRTWDVLQEYDKKYPGLFKLHRNEPNVGIFENIEYTWTMPTGDVIYQLSGDDACGEGWFKTVAEYIQKNKIDYKNELFCIYGDYKAVYPNGDSFVYSNHLVNRYPDSLLSMSFRGCIGSRSACYSTNILKQFKKVSQGRSYISESVMDRQLQQLTEKSYYVPQVGNVYFANIGVCVSMSSSEKEGRMDIYEYSISYFNQFGILSDKDILFLKYRTAMLHYRRTKTCSDLYKSWYYQNRALIFKFDFCSARIKRILFAIRRRIPHSEPLEMRIS